MWPQSKAKILEEDSRGNVHVFETGNILQSFKNKNVQDNREYIASLEIKFRSNFFLNSKAI